MDLVPREAVGSSNSDEMNVWCMFTSSVYLHNAHAIAQIKKSNFVLFSQKIKSTLSKDC